MHKRLDMNISWRELLWEGETIDGEFMRGQLFRFNGHYYICNNIPYTYEECMVMGQKPPEVGSWYEVKSGTLKKCEWEQEKEIGNVYYKNGVIEPIIKLHSDKLDDMLLIDFETESGKYHYREWQAETENGYKYKDYHFKDSNFEIIEHIDFIVVEKDYA